MDDDHCTRLNKPIAQNHAQVVTRADGRKYVTAGAIFPANDAAAIGIVYEDVDVTSGDMPGSVVTAGAVYACTRYMCSYGRFPAMGSVQDSCRGIYPSAAFGASSPCRGAFWPRID